MSSIYRLSLTTHLRPLPSSPSPRSAPRTSLSFPSSSRPSRRATWRRTRRPSVTGAVASWALSPTPRPQRRPRPSRAPSRSKQLDHSTLQLIPCSGVRMSISGGVPWLETVSGCVLSRLAFFSSETQKVIKADGIRGHTRLSYTPVLVLLSMILYESRALPSLT